MKRLKVVSSLLMIVLSPILLGGCSGPEDINGEVRGYCETNPNKCGIEGKIKW